ncbi:hemerythrin domain-containing protein [Gordonia rubripertincta]|uniref:hemerythrin domain-containing protein n=1 Tax=Gordonia rubripertincta TaxID=36822 RepID=UPI000B8D64AB|nr:hemerythrin domain-containing protein [Gordonia rubripertincta]ASR00992.1 hypothetical protein GCWB2_00775 [Gordonia rubripertincta]
MSTDAIVILKDDHKEIRKLFRDFKSQGPNAVKTKGKIVDKIIEALTVHTYIENECMYPEIRKRVPDLEDDILESYEEEEDEWFPKVREALGRKDLQEIGEEMLRLKEKAPRRPSQPSALKKTVDAIIK